LAHDLEIGVPYIYRFILRKIDIESDKFLYIILLSLYIMAFPRSPTRAERSAYIYNEVKNPYESGEIKASDEKGSIGHLGWGNEEVLNINILYLESLHALINQYIICSFRGEMETALNSLMILANTMSPKIDTSEEEAMIEKVEHMLPTFVVRDTNGEIVRYNPQGLANARKQVRTIYRKLLHKLDSKGMLTYQPKDYKSILGDFSKS
jgi:hypothetical protein